MEQDIIKNIAQAPAIALEKTVNKLSKRRIDLENFRKVHNYWSMLGPGLVTGAADDDPSGIATYSQTGARYGFQLLWLAGFMWAMKSGQFDDLEGNAERILRDDD